MGKGGGKAHTPREARDNLKSSQMLSVIDAISEGPVYGPVDGLKSVRLNGAYFHERRSLNNFHRDRVITFEQIAE